ncbi:MAG TPA: class I SAM-dependent methyltransferase [Polyangiaceae bacterium]
MALQRVLEPEVMDTAQEAADYDAMDHGEVNARFVGDLLAVQPSPGHVLDVGTGTALIPIELCKRAPGANVDAIDLAAHMLELAKRNVARAGLEGRLRLALQDAKKAGWPEGAFDTVMSNSIVHHIPDPRDVLGEMWRLTRAGGVLFVRDLARPDGDGRVRELVATHAAVPAGLAPDVRAMHERQRDLFEASLRAALTVDEVGALAGSLGMPAGSVHLTSDRHWTLACRKPTARRDP